MRAIAVAFLLAGCSSATGGTGDFEDGLVWFEIECWGVCEGLLTAADGNATFDRTEDSSLTKEQGK